MILKYHYKKPMFLNFSAQVYGIIIEDYDEGAFFQSVMLSVYFYGKGQSACVFTTLKKIEIFYLLQFVKLNSLF